VLKVGIDEHTLDSALDPNELARVETESARVAPTVTRPSNSSDDQRFQFPDSSMGILLFQNRGPVVSDIARPRESGSRFFPAAPMRFTSSWTWRPFRWWVSI
jgi:magnesium transporter